MYNMFVYFPKGDAGKEKLIPLIQGPSDTKDLHRSKWLKETRKPESILGPDLIAFTVQVPEQMDYCHSSGKCKTSTTLRSYYILLLSATPLGDLIQNVPSGNVYLFHIHCCSIASPSFGEVCVFFFFHF